MLFKAKQLSYSRKKSCLKPVHDAYAELCLSKYLILCLNWPTETPAIGRHLYQEKKQVPDYIIINTQQFIPQERAELWATMQSMLSRQHSLSHRFPSTLRNEEDIWRLRRKHIGSQCIAFAVIVGRLQFSFYTVSSNCVALVLKYRYCIIFSFISIHEWNNASISTVC